MDNTKLTEKQRNDFCKHVKALQIAFYDEYENGFFERSLLKNILEMVSNCPENTQSAYDIGLLVCMSIKLADANPHSFSLKFKTSSFFEKKFVVNGGYIAQLTDFIQEVIDSLDLDNDPDPNIEFHCEDVLEHLKRQSDCSIHTTFADPPYFLGTEWYQDANNRWQMKGTGSDFMGAWGVQNADWWREYFAELHRVMKFGGYVVMYSITQQSDMVSSLLREAGFEKCAENGSGTLHWANISNFPKASCASKAVDRKVGAERQVVGKKIDVDGKFVKAMAKNYKGNGFGVFENDPKNVESLTAPASPLATLLNGYKYGKAPLKKITEPILVFRKRLKNKSVLNDLMQCQSDPEISPAILDIEGNRVATNETNLGRILKQDKPSVFQGKPTIGLKLGGAEGGRYPCTQFMSPAAAEMLDMQLDMITFELNGKIYTKKRLEMVAMVAKAVQNNELQNFKEVHCKRESLHSGSSTGFYPNKTKNSAINNGKGFLTSENRIGDPYEKDSGYISRVMHQPDFTNDDYDSLISAYNAYNIGINEDTIYCPTVSPKERNKGCESLLYKGIDTICVLKTNPKTQKTSRSKYDFDMISDYEINPNSKKSKDIETAFVKLFYDLVCESSEDEVNDINFVDLAILAKDYENEIGGFYYLGNDLFKVFVGTKDLILEVKNVIRNGNGHPTLKPIALNKQVAGLFLLPKVFEQTVYIPFGGAGSELIAWLLLGIKNIIYVEKNPDFVNIAKHRVKYYANIEVKTEGTLQDQPKPKPIEQTKLF
jgi:DNA modification methylase